MATAITGKLNNVQTTAIGSLPHHNIDAALAIAFKTTIPFLPQIPIRNPWEFMLAQAMEGIPGLQVENDGAVAVNIDVWQSQSASLDRALAQAFSTNDFEPFEPSTAIASGWQPFVWELQERNCSTAKIQIAGPLTAQWSLITSKAATAELAMQVYRLVLARALAMTQKLKSCGIAPIVYIDEPALYGLDLTNPKHAVGVRELGLLVQTLRKGGATVGIHCCSNTDWSALLNLGIDILSIDSTLSLPSLLAETHVAEIEKFVASNGRLSLGVVPTARSGVLRSLTPNQLFETLLGFFQSSRAWRDRTSLIQSLLSRAIYTPACGLALHSVSDADFAIELLQEFYLLAQKVGNSSS